MHVAGPQVGPRCPRDTLWIYPEVVVEAPVLHGDDRARELPAEAVEANRLAALLDREIPDLVTVSVVDVGVLYQLGVSAVQALPVLADHEPVRADKRYDGGYGQDQGEVEEDPERPEEEAETPSLGGLLACLEEAVHGSPAHQSTSTSHARWYHARMSELSCTIRRVGDLESRTEEYEISYAVEGLSPHKLRVKYQAARAYEINASLDASVEAARAAISDAGLQGPTDEALSQFAWRTIQSAKYERGEPLTSRLEL